MTLYTFRFEKGDGHFSLGPTASHETIDEARAHAAELLKGRGWEQYYFWEQSPGVSIYEAGELLGQVYYDGRGGGYLFEDGQTAKLMNPETGQITRRPR